MSTKTYGHCDHCGMCWTSDPEVPNDHCLSCHHTSVTLYDAPPCEAILGEQAVAQWCDVCKNIIA